MQAVTAAPKADKFEEDLCIRGQFISLGAVVLVSDAAEAAADDCSLVVLREPDELPPILAGHQIPKLRARAESFYVGVAELSERWAARHLSHHTRPNFNSDTGGEFGQAACARAAK